MINFIVSLLLGMLPEVLYFTLFLTFTKNIKTKRIKLFILLSIGYILLIMICRYQLIFYLAYIVYSYLILKLLYKSEIIDFFICSLGYSYLTIISISAFIVIPNYWIAFFMNRILLFAPFILKSKFNKLYMLYRSLWNRNDKVKQPIKSLTLRNCSLLMINTFIIILDVVILYIIAIIS